MSRRVVQVEEFDDDTDLALPSHPLPNTGARGAILEELYPAQDDDDDDDVIPQLTEPTAGPASPSQQQFRPQSHDGTKVVTDITPYKTWTCIYPIYIDAKRPYGTGERRIAREKSVWWPLSKDIVEATSRMGLKTLHEVNKSHPRDWDNPGRVRVQWKNDGKLVNPVIKTKRQLLETIAAFIQHTKPDTVPKPPYEYHSSETAVTPAPPTRPTPASTTKGKQPASKSKMSASSPAPAPIKQKRNPSLPFPPKPEPALADRVSPYSPALPTGMLIETVKAGMSAQETGGAAGGMPGTGGQKGKRKVVRVRG